MTSLSLVQKRMRHMFSSGRCGHLYGSFVLAGTERMGAIFGKVVDPLCNMRTWCFTCNRKNFWGIINMFPFTQISQRGIQTGLATDPLR